MYVRELLQRKALYKYALLLSLLFISDPEVI